ncbi:DGK1 [Malassezia furfur]|nr:DGK1 [Malassezia furfur]
MRRPRRHEPRSAGAGAGARAVHPLHSARWEKIVVKWEVPRKVLHASIGFVVLALYGLNVDLDRIVRVLSYMLAFIASMDLLRLNLPGFERAYEAVVGALMRDGERERVNGVVWYLVGVLASLRLFPEDIACVSIMILSWCDPCASTFGRLYGRYTPSMPAPLFAQRKSLAGFLAAVLAGSLTTYLFWGTSLARRGERASGLSWTPGGTATFGTRQAPGLLHTGWTGIRGGFVARGDASVWAHAVAAGGGAPAVPAWLLYVAAGLVAGVTESLDLGGIDDNLFIPVLSGLGIWATLWVWGLCV